MRPPPETRSRRQSDPNQLSRLTKLKRLTNGFMDDHVTTRSQAKCTKSKNRLSKTLKRKLSPVAKGSDNANSPTTNNNNNVNSKNKNSSRLNGLVNNNKRDSSSSRVGRLENLGERKLGRESRLGKKPSFNGLSHGKNSSRNNSNSSQRTTTGSKSQSLLFTHHRYQHFDNSGGPKTEKERVALQRAVAAEKRADRAKKRRSALWVLNCEAESFLFGETAADKHEVELPPLSPPPKKRRRFRTNELGNLLKESSIIGSKLRSPTPQDSPKDQSIGGSLIKSRSDNTATRSPHQKNNSKKLLPDLPGKDLSVSLRVSVDDSDDDDDDDDDDDEHDDVDINLKNQILPLASSQKEDELTSLSSPISSIYSSLGSPNSLSNNNHNDCSQSVRIQSILTSMDLRFSFEDVPTDEVWYSTFQRQEHPETSALLTPARNYNYEYYNYGNSCNYFTSSPPPLLPYERKLLNQPRSLTKGRLSRGRLPRKSPRCHASTLAILSSLKRGRNRNSVLLPQSPALASPSATTTSCFPSPTTSITSTPVASSSNASICIPVITVAKPPEEEESKPKSSGKQAMMTRKLSKSFSKAKATRIPHHNRLTTMKGKHANNPSSSSPLSPSQNQLTIQSCWRLGSNKSSTLPPVSPPMLSSRPQSPSPSPSTPPDKCPHRIRDISATQYLWDSIQLLSDPYVIQVLAGEKAGSGNKSRKPSSTSSSCASPNSVKANNVNLKSNKANQLFLRNSRKDEDKDVCTDHHSDETGASSCRQHADDCTALGTVTTTTVASSLSSPSSFIRNSKVVPSPKSSPKNNINNNVKHNNNNSYIMNGVQLSKFPCSHTTRHCKYKQTKVSSCSSPKNAKLNNNNNSNQLHHLSNNKNVHSNNVNNSSRNGIHTHYNPRKSPRKSPIVLVSDIFKIGNHNINNIKPEEKAILKAADSVAVASLPDQQPSQQQLQQTPNNSNGMIKAGRQDLLFLLEGPLPVEWPV